MVASPRAVGAGACRAIPLLIVALLAAWRWLGDAEPRLRSHALREYLGLAQSGDHARCVADAPLTPQAREDGTTAVPRLLLGISVWCGRTQGRLPWNYHRHSPHSP
jgi:hypothetical protein